MSSSDQQSRTCDRSTRPLIFDFWAESNLGSSDAVAIRGRWTDEVGRVLERIAEQVQLVQYCGGSVEIAGCGNSISHSEKQEI